MKYKNVEDQPTFRNYMFSKEQMQLPAVIERNYDGNFSFGETKKFFL